MAGSEPIDVVTPVEVVTPAEAVTPEADSTGPTFSTPGIAMTRRELRELRKKAEAAGDRPPEVVRSANGSYALTDSITVVPEPDAGDGGVEDSAVDGARIGGSAAGNPVVENSTVVDSATGDAAEATPAVFPISEVRVADTDAAPGSAATPEDETVEAPPEQLVPFDALFVPGSTGIDGPDPAHLIAEALSSDRGVEPAPDSGAYGHWSMQALDDQEGEAAASRSDIINPATGAITTQALVLPSMPSAGEESLSVADGNTGEFMVTGTVDLPRSFGSTGMHPAVFDHPDVDALIERSDPDEAVPESSPVRAVDSVSSAASARGLVISPAPRNARLPLIAAISLGSVLLVGIGVVAAGFIFNLF